MAFHFEAEPLLVQEDRCLFGASLPRHLQFSPDGLMLLCTADNRVLRTLHLPQHTFMDTEANAAGRSTSNIAPLGVLSEVVEADAVRDVTWSPRASSHDPSTALFAAAVKDQPVHLWNSLTGSQAASYVGTNHLDEVVGAHALAFSPDGSKLVGGYERMVLAWDAARPGRESSRWMTTPTKRSLGGQRGIISCIAFNPYQPPMYACGSFEGSIVSYDVRSGHVGSAFLALARSGRLVGFPGGCSAAGVDSSAGLALPYHREERREGARKRRRSEEGEEGESGKPGSSPSSSSSSLPAPSPESAGGRMCAVTQVAFTRDGTYLCAGFRRSDDIAVWDVRHPSAPVYRLQRRGSATNQRLQFSVDPTGRYLVTGSSDGAVHVYDVPGGQHVRSMVGMFNDATASVALHPCGVAFAVATGQRHHARGDNDGKESESGGDGSDEGNDSVDGLSGSDRSSSKPAGASGLHGSVATHGDSGSSCSVGSVASHVMGQESSASSASADDRRLGARLSIWRTEALQQPAPALLSTETKSGTLQPVPDLQNGSPLGESVSADV